MTSSTSIGTRARSAAFALALGSLALLAADRVQAQCTIDAQGADRPFGTNVERREQVGHAPER